MAIPWNTARPEASAKWDAGPAIVIPPRVAIGALLAGAIVAMALRMLPADSPSGWMLRVAGASTLLGVVPGALALYAWRPRSSFDLLELFGLSFAVSFGVVQLATVLAIALHLPPQQTLMALGVLTAIHAAVAFKNGRHGVLVRVEWGALALLGTVAALGLFLYASGSPYDAIEDRIHVALVQRLAYLDAPSPENIYFAPGVRYTYPFPGTHYMLALMARIGDIEPLFLYHKLRAFWGVAAPLLLYGCVRTAFDSTRIAVAATVVAVALVAAGPFAAVPGLYWAQMAPYSHASDVAMGVLLPALLLLAFAFLRAHPGREYGFFLAATLMMAAMLIAVHPRESVQFLVYLTAFWVALTLTGGPRPMRTRALTLIVSAASLLLAYRYWYVVAVPEIEALVADRRQLLGDLWKSASWTSLLGRPLPLMQDFMPALQPTFYGWNPVVLAASPGVLYALRRAPLALFVAASIACYLLIIRIPLFGIPYVYLTYQEILYTPVRNVIFFVHMLAGVSLYLIAASLARLGYAGLVVLALATAAAIVQVLWRFGPYASEHIDALFVPALAGFAAVTVLLRRQRASAYVDVRSPPPRRWLLVFALLVLPVLAATWTTESAVVTAAWTHRRSTPDALMAEMACGDDGGFCAPPRALISLARERLPATAVLAVDRRDGVPPALFLPQQMVMWPGTIEGLVRPERLFARYYHHWELAKAAAREQPFFNDEETRDERLAFIRDLGVTHVLVNANLYPTMNPVFASDTTLFSVRYDDGLWALYEVTP